MRREVAAGEMTAGARWGDKHWFWDHQSTDVSEAHPPSGFAAQSFKLVCEVAVGREFRGCFVAGDADIGGVHRHDRHGRINQ